MNNKYLVAYYVAESQLTEKNIISTIAKELPEYMIPSAFVQLETFPLTVNGKLDRKALPDPGFSNEESYVTPTTDLERKLCSIWQEVLNLEKVGVSDDFFRIGGNSIMVIKLHHKMNSELETPIEIADIFKLRTIIDMVDFLKRESVELLDKNEMWEI